MHIAVIDIGSPKKRNLGWAIRGPRISDQGGISTNVLQR
jgi:hypothetical protein